MDPRAGCLALGLLACAEPRETLWVADRAAGELIALDAELLVRERIQVASPGLLVASGEVLWVAAQPPADAPRPAGLLRIDRRAQEMLGLDVGEIVALSLAPAGDAVLALERSGGSETLLWRVGTERARTLLGSFVDAGAVAAQSGAILVGSASGELVRLAADGAVAASGALAGPVRALARGPRAGEWWSLAGTGPTALALLDRSLAPLWCVETGLDARRLAPVPDAERVWIAAGAELRCYGPGGKLELARGLPSGAWAAEAATSDAVFLLAAGALLELSVHGTRVDERRTQGGFAGLAALVRGARSASEQ